MKNLIVFGTFNHLIRENRKQKLFQNLFCKIFCFFKLMYVLWNIQLLKFFHNTESMKRMQERKKSKTITEFNNENNSNQNFSEKISELCLKKNEKALQSHHKTNEIVPLTDNVKQPEQMAQSSCCENFFNRIKIISTNVCFNIMVKIFLLVFLAACVLQALTRFERLPPIGQTIQKCCFGFFLIFFVIEILSWRKSQKVYLIIDFLYLSASLAVFIVENQEALRYLKTIRCLKILLFMKSFQNLKQAMNIFLYSWKKVGRVLLPLFILIYLIAVVNIYLFSDLEYNKCRDPINKNFQENWTVYSEDVFLCGEERSCPVVEGIQYDCLNPMNFGVKPNQQQLANMAQGYGLIVFSDIGHSIFSTIKQIFVTNSSKIITLYKSSFAPECLIAYYLLFIFFIPYIYFNIFYALLLSIRNKKRERKKDSQTDFSISQKKSSEKQSEGKNFNQMESFIFSQAQSPIISPKIETHLNSIKKSTPTENSQNPRPESVQNSKSINIFEIAEEISVQSHSKSLQFPGEEQKEEEDQSCLQFFKNVRVLIVCLCCINYLLQFEGQSKQFEYVTKCIHLTFYLLFLIQILCLLILEKCLKKNKTGFQLKIEISIAVLYLTGLIYDAVLSNSFEQFIEGDTLFSTIFRSFLYFRLFTTLSSSPYFSKKSNQILPKIAQTIYMVRYFIVMWFIIMITLTLMGFHLHSSQFNSLEQNDWCTKFNFQGFYSSLIYTLLIVFNEEWDTLMLEQYYRSKSPLIIVWSFFVLIIGYIMFSKYLTCLLATELDKIIGRIERKLCDQKDEKATSLDNKSKINEVISIEEEEVESEQENCSTICCRKFTDILRVTIKSAIFVRIKIVITLIVGFTVLVTHPQADHSSDICRVARNLSYSCTFFFFFEFLAKVKVHGLWDTKEPLITRVLFILYSLILLVEILMPTPLSNFYIYYRIEKVRAFRLIYFIEERYQQNWDMRVLMKSVFRLSLKNQKTAVLFLLAIFYFGLILTKLYKNDYYYCDNADSAPVATKQDCLNWGGDWIKYPLNFSSPYQSTKYVLYVTTMGGWTFLMSSAMDMSGDGMAPSLKANAHIQTFFIFLFFCGNLIILNLFISTTLDCYRRIKEEETGESQLAEEERTWLRVKIQILNLEPVEQQVQPDNFFRKSAYRLWKTKVFNIIKSLLFFSPVLFLTFYPLRGKSELEDKILWTYFIILAGVQNMIHILAFGLKKKYCYHIFLTGSILIYFGLIFGKCSQSVKNRLEILLLILVFLIYIKLIDEIQSAKKMFNTILTILPRSVNIFLLFFTIFFAYTVLGMELFSFLKFGKQLDEFNQNYTHPLNAFYSVLKFSFVEASIDQIIDTSATLAPNFICHQINNYEEFLKFGQNGCGNSIVSDLFFLSFHSFYTIYQMSIFFAFIVDAYDDIRREENSHVTKYLLKKVQILWSQKDPQASGLIPYRQFWGFTKQLVDLYEGENSSSRQNRNLMKEREELMQKLNLTVYQNENGLLSFQFQEFILNLTKIYLQKKSNCVFNDEVVDPVVRKWVDRKKKSYLKKTKFNSSNIRSLILLKSGLKVWKHNSTENSRYFTFSHINQIVSKKNEKVKPPLLTKQ